MKISEVIRLAGLVEKGNVMEEELAVLWLSELDGMIQSDIMLHSPEEIVSYSSKEDELIVKPPHDKLYVHYLVMMIRQQQQEYEGYQNAQAVVDEKLRTFRRWYVQHYRPADSLSDNGAVSDPGTWGFAYITAYGLAVQQGYRGTLDEWLESLKGEAGEAARMRYDAERETVQWGVGEQWYDLFTLSELRDPAVDAIIAQAEAAAKAAAESAQTAEIEAQKAQQSMERAGLDAQSANAAAEVAEDAAEAAAGSAADAEAHANAARKSEDNSRLNLHEAEVAAQAAQEAARSIGVGGVKVTDGEAVGVWLQAEGTEREPVLHLYGDHGDEPTVVRNVARAELDRDAVPLGQVKELVAAAGGGGLTVTDDGNGNITITGGGTSSMTDDGNGNIVFL